MIFWVIIGDHSEAVVGLKSAVMTAQKPPGHLSLTLVHGYTEICTAGAWAALHSPLDPPRLTLGDPEAISALNVRRGGGRKRHFLSIYQGNKQLNNPRTPFRLGYNQWQLVH